MNPVLTKADFARRYQEGEFGNSPPTWDSVEDWCKERARGFKHASDDRLYHLRNKIKGGKTHFNLECWRLYSWCKGTSWVHEDNWYVSEMAPTASTIIQGEVQVNEFGLYLRYSDVVNTMRKALAEKEYLVTGLRAKFILQKNLNSKSFEWLQYLLETYDGHVVEFSTYSHCWGLLPGYNTVFWEVRKY